MSAIPDNRLIIRLAPSNAFGVGNHVSTQAFLRELENTDLQGIVLDVGSGSGILSLAVLMLGAPGVDSIDIIPEAVRVTQANIEANGLSQRFTVIAGDVRNTSDLKDHYDLVLMNIDSPGMILDVVARVSFDAMLAMPETKDMPYLNSALEAAQFRVELLEEVGQWTFIRISRGG